MTHAIQIENLCKQYKLGLTHSGSIRELANGLVRALMGRGKKDAGDAVVDASRVRDGHFLALDDVSFEVGEGEVVGIIGKNGAGKSTLLKLLSRITYPTSGRAVLHGRIASLLEVGTGFHPELTGRENVFLNGTILGMTRREVNGKLDDIVDFAGVAKFLDTPVKRYSSGMKVRLGFAVAAHLDPEILIVDEVLAVGDVEFQKRCLGKMQNVADSGKTVLFVSHNLASIRSLTTRTVVLSKGRLIFDGGTEEGVQRYIQENIVTPSEDVSVADLPRTFSNLDRKLEFIDLEISNDEDPDADVDPLLPRKFTLRVKVRARETVEPFMIGLTIYSDDASPVGNTFGPTQNPVSAGEEAEYHFDLRLPVAPGKYHCAISLCNVRSAARVLHDSLVDVLPFEVKPASLDALAWSAGWGRVVLPRLTLSAESDHTQSEVSVS